MTQPHHDFPQYGTSGDHAGARRSRRSFRILIGTIVLLTGILWFTEHYLRYSDPEEKYKMALTLEPQSARPLLQYAVRVMEAGGGQPSPKYLEALAYREEDDKTIPLFRRARELDPTNAALAIRFGCRLYKLGNFEQALGNFRDASLHDDTNALAFYLEAATLPFVNPAEIQLDESLAIIARTNKSAATVSIPEPLWHPDLPRRGQQYEHLRRDITDECLAPLYLFSNLHATLADEAIKQGQLLYWDSWLATIEDMGARLLTTYQVPPTQAMASIVIQREALKRRVTIAEKKSGGVEAQLVARELKLAQAQEILSASDNRRSAALQERLARYREPLYLCTGALLILLGFFFLSSMACRISKVHRESWALDHPLHGRIVLSVLPTLLLALLYSYSSATWNDPATSFLDPIFGYIWYGLLVIWVGFGPFYPLTALPTLSVVLRNMNPSTDSTDTVRHAAKRARHIAALALIRRYYGIAMGFQITVVCLWFILHRITFGLYPLQFKMLPTGLTNEDAQTLKEIMKLLLPS